MRIGWGKSPRSSDRLFAIKRGGKIGYIDGAGKVVITPQFHDDQLASLDFFEGLAAVSTGGRPGAVNQMGCIDRAGKWAISPHFSVAGDFSEGLAHVSNVKDGFKTGFIDRSGRYVITPRFQTVSNFSEGLVSFREDDPKDERGRYVGRIGKAGYADKTGKIVIPATYGFADDFSEGLARIALDGMCQIPGHGVAPSVTPENDCGGVPANARSSCRQGFIDRTGRVAIEPRFDDAASFHEGLAAVSLGGKWGFIDPSGAVVIPFQFQNAKSFSSGLAAVEIGDRWGFVDKTGTLRVGTKFKQAWEFHDGLALIQDESGKFGYADMNGALLIPAQYDFAVGFGMGLANVHIRGNQFGYIDKLGRVVYRYEGSNYFGQ